VDVIFEHSHYLGSKYHVLYFYKNYFQGADPDGATTQAADHWLMLESHRSMIAWTAA